MKTENQEELELIVPCSKNQRVALVVGRESAVRSWLRLFDYHLDCGIVRDLQDLSVRQRNRLAMQAK